MSKISLCMIVGNVEDYIERCLKSFIPIADEVVIVRAIGNKLKDGTESIAKGVCREAKIPILFSDYKNKPGHEDWPHVDDFAAARQQSFDMATGDFCFWCDSDDVLESGADVVRELADRGGYSCFIFPYKIFGRGLSVPRERMMARGSGKWMYAVHECFRPTIEPVEAFEDQRVVVLHMPHETKTGSNERNLRILESLPESEMTTGLLYHYHVELALANRAEESIATAEKVLARPDLGKPEKFELFINLARMALLNENFTTERAMLHQAYAADPRRREALGLLCNNALNTYNFEDALAYGRQMMATPAPKLREWNDRDAFYGWVGEDLFMQALRANRLYEEAAKVRAKGFELRGRPRISLLHATRGRAIEAAKTRKLWLDSAEKPELVDHIFAFDSDDEDSQILSRMNSILLPKGGGCVAAWNIAAFASVGDVLVQLSDDWRPVPMWDKLILDRIGDVSRPRVLAISDGVRKDNLLCMAICTRNYWFQDYFLFHPWFTGVYSDNWFTDMAYARGQVIDAKDIVFQHNHPIATGENWDKTYAEQNAPHRYAEGEAVYRKLITDSDWSTVPGYFNYWPFYRVIAGQLKDGDTIAEVGTWFGRSLIFMAQELKRAGKKVKLLAVDTFKGELNQPEHEATVAAHGGSIRAAFEANLKRCGVDDMVEIIEGDSAESAARVADGSLAFCFIDAAHDYESVKRDVAAWKPKLRAGGVLSGHDAQWPPVVQAVKELIPTAEFSGVIWGTQL